MGVDDVVHCGTISEENAVVCIGVDSVRAFLGFLGNDAAAELEETVNCWRLLGIGLIWAHVKRAVECSI